MFWEIVGFVGGEGHLEERGEGDIEVGVSVAAIDEGGEGDGGSAGVEDDIDGFLGAAAAGDDVLDDEDFFMGFDGEVASEGELVVDFFGEDEAFGELASDLLSDHEASHGRGEDGIAIDISEFLDKEMCEAGDLGEVFSDFGALEEVFAMEAGAEYEVAGEEGARFFKDIEGFVLIVIHV